MASFERLRAGELTAREFVDALSVDDLRDLTNEVIDEQLRLIAECTDADVSFVPVDTRARDPYAMDPDERAMAWTLGHVLVHVTATSEEAAFLAAELARGISREGRSRYETPWRTITTIEQCRRRLQESRRMRLATLDVWPGEPHLDVISPASRPGTQRNAIGRFVRGLFHDDEHLAQIAEIVRQAQAARQAG